MQNWGLSTQITCALQVLFADGSVSFSQDSGPVWVPDSEVEEENTSQETEDKGKNSKHLLMNVLGPLHCVKLSFVYV